MLPRNLPPSPLLLSTLLIFLLSSQFSYAQTTNVVWQHGLNGNAESWQEFAIDFQNERRMISSRPSFTGQSLQGVVPFTNAIDNFVSTLPNNNTIGVGHSMGGVAFRELESVTAPGSLDAIVTVGSPLNGAIIADGLFDGRVAAYSAFGARRLLRGPTRQFPFVVAVAVLGTRFLTGQDLHEIVIDENAIDELIIEAAENAPATIDLQQNGPYMNNARNIAINTPHVSIYSQEDRPVHYRLASSFNEDDDDDEPLVRTVNRAEGLYNFFYLYNRARWWSPVAWYRAVGWRHGRDYLRQGSETGWNALIGATRIEQRQTCTRRLTCSFSEISTLCFDGRGGFDPDCPACFQNTCQTLNVVINEPSDGLLPVSTQQGASTAGQPSNWNPEELFEVLGANHLEQQVHPGVDVRLNQIFNRENGISLDFMVPPR